MNPGSNVTITVANGGYIVSSENGLFVASNLNAAVRLVKEALAPATEVKEAE